MMMAAAGHTVIVKEVRARMVPRMDTIKQGVIDSNKCF